MQEKLIDAETKITVAEIGAEDGKSEDSIANARLNIDKLKKDWEEMNKKYALENKKHGETVRHNKVTEKIDKKKATQKPVTAR